MPKLYTSLVLNFAGTYLSRNYNRCNFAILVKEYFVGFYFRDFNKQTWKKGIKFCNLSALNFIFFF